MKNKIIDFCYKMAKENKTGCLFCIETENVKKEYYAETYKDVFLGDGRMLSVLDDKQRKIITKLAEIDGAVIITSSGFMKEFGVILKNIKPYGKFGARHAAANGTSEKIRGTICILRSELREDKSEGDGHIRMFRDGFCEYDLDKETFLPPTTEQKIVEMISHPAVPFFTALGLTLTIIPFALPALVVFKGGEVIVSKGMEPIKNFLENKYLICKSKLPTNKAASPPSHK